MTVLTAHFTWADVVRSETAKAKGIDNSLPPALIPNVERSAAMMERVRTLLGGKPIDPSSWYRCWQLNAAVGSGKRSVHPLGLAVDFDAPAGMTNAEAIDLIAASDLAFDQLIHEATADGADWIHAGLAPLGKPPRRQILTADGITLGGPMTFTRTARG